MAIRDIQAGTEVEIQGYVHDFRDLGGIKFILVRDNTGIIQVTVVKSKAPEAVQQATDGLTNESVVTITGTAQPSEKAERGIEVLPRTITVHARSEPELPIQVVDKGIATDLSKRLDWRTLDLRKPERQATFMIQSALLEGARRYLLTNGFIQVFTPCILGVASEGGSEVFPVIYFDKEAFLRQDPQLHRQLAIAGGIPRIFDIGPAWRAEQSHTTKHLCEHRVIAVELAFIKDEYDTMRIEEQMVAAALQHVRDTCGPELALLNATLNVPKTPFPVLTFPEVYAILAKRGKNVERGSDMDTEAEKVLWEYVQETYGTEFYFLNRFPSKIKPFYVKRDDTDPEHANSVDLYYRGLELSSGGQREHRYTHIMKNAKDAGMKESSIEWFSKHFKYGVPPHGGFALGIERLTQSLLGIGNIRDCVIFPRDPERLVP